MIKSNFILQTVVQQNLYAQAQHKKQTKRDQGAKYFMCNPHRWPAEGERTQSDSASQPVPVQLHY